MSRQRSDHENSSDHATVPVSPTEAEPETEAEVEPDIEPDAVVDIELDEEIVVVDDDPVVVLDEDGEDEEDAEAEPAVVAAPVVRPTPRPQPGRPPSAKEEPPPPFAIGERVILIQNTRPRTGTPIGVYPVGSTGRVETVLSQTAIVRFDIAPETKEVVAFTCLESLEKAPDGSSLKPEAEPLR